MKQRIKTNIVELNQLFKLPCQEWLNRFVDGKINAHEAFKNFSEKYEWLYKNSNYDLIGWEIDNEVFNWAENSWAVAKFCPEHFDPDKYNWAFSYCVAIYCPDKIDPNKFRWACCGKYVMRYCPEKMFLMPERYRRNYKQNFKTFSK